MSVRLRLAVHKRRRPITEHPAFGPYLAAVGGALTELSGHLTVEEAAERFRRALIGGEVGTHGMTVDELLDNIDQLLSDHEEGT